MADVYFTDNLKFLRNYPLKKKQNEFAKFLGFKVTAYNNYETGTSIPSILDLKGIAEKFSITVDELMFTDLSKTETPPKSKDQEGVVDEKKVVDKIESSLQSLSRGQKLISERLGRIEDFLQAIDLSAGNIRGGGDDEDKSNVPFDAQVKGLVPHKKGQNK